MTNPTSGPFTRSYTLTDPASGFKTFIRNSTWYRQKKPHNLPLSYSVDIYNYVSWFRSSGKPASSVDGIAPPLDVGSCDLSYNKAYAKFLESYSSSSMWAVNLKEMEQTYALVHDPAIKLFRFARALHKFDFPAASKILKAEKPRGLKKGSQYFGDNFLKYHFGWEPLVQDIGAAIDTIQRPFPPGKICFGKGSHHFTPVVKNAQNTVTTDVLTHCRIQAEVQVSNPNLFLASQLGFVNPLAIAWELVPFSFVVDWFVNVGQCLASFTDFAGVTLVNPSRTFYQVNERDNYWPPPTDTHGMRDKSMSMFMRRIPGTLPGPVLKVKPWKGISPVRAATAISLLVQQLR